MCWKEAEHTGEREAGATTAELVHLVPDGRRKVTRAARNKAIVRRAGDLERRPERVVCNDLPAVYLSDVLSTAYHPHSQGSLSTRIRHGRGVKTAN